MPGNRCAGTRWWCSGRRGQAGPPCDVACEGGAAHPGERAKGKSLATIAEGLNRDGVEAARSTVTPGRGSEFSQ